MKQEPSSTGISVEQMPARPTREMLHSRTLELAFLAGRRAHQIKQADYEQAKREVTREWDFDRQQKVLDGFG